MKNNLTGLISILITVLFFSAVVFSQTTEFTYQGRLLNASTPAAGNYDFEFALYDAVSGGAQVGSTLTRSTVAVSNGDFSVKLDFGGAFPGANRFLEIRVRQTGGGAFTPLAPRQQINSAPYSVKAVNATNATNATNAATATNATQLGGIAASQYVLTGDARLSDARNPLPGSANYVQNQNAAPQAASNFNISGNGTIGGTLTSNISNATRYDINGSRVITEPTMSSIFVGRFAGNLTAFANSNSFFGSFAGSQTTSGGENTFVGAQAAELNTSGSFNAFFGAGSGNANTTGRFNTIIGRAANVGSGALEFATALGADAVVSTSNSVVLGRSVDTVRIPGNLNLAGSFTGNFTVPAGNITGILPAANGGSGLSSPGASGNFLRSNGTAWTSSALQTADVPDLGASYVKNTTSPQTGNFNISGNGTANIVNATTQYNIGGSRVLSNGGQGNLFAGRDAGTANTTGFTNSFFGAQSGQSNTTGGANSFFGFGAGQSNTTSFNNSFFGTTSGQSNTNGEDNSFFGAYSGGVNANGNFNSFFGAGTGAANTEGSLNSFFGGRAGGSNIIGGFNSFFGESAGFTNTTGSNNTILGYAANVGSGNLSNATAIGANSMVSQSSSLVLGSISGLNGATAGTSVGIGVAAPAYKLHVVDASNQGLRVQTNTAGGTIASFGGNGAFQIDGSGLAGGRLKVLENGNVGIGMPVGSNVNNKLDVVGTVGVWTLGTGGSVALCWHTGGFNLSTCGSSLRYKKNLSRFTNGLELLRRFQPITFDWKEGGMHDLGLGAEDVAAIEPLLVTYNKDGQVEGVKYDRIGVVLINAIKEQQQQIDKLQKQVDELTKRAAETKALRKLVCSFGKRAKVCR